MKDKIVDYLRRMVDVTDEEATRFALCFDEVKIKKRQLIVQPDYVTAYRNYVVEGAFRSYLIADDGTDHTINFAVEDWWITDYNSYIFQQPATMFVVALEDSIILRISFSRERELKKGNHRFETFFRIIAERGLAFQQRRIISNLMHTAEQRYENYLKNYPGIVQRVPQYALASYLNMTTEFLSRIRNKRAKKKS